METKKLEEENENQEQNQEEQELEKAILKQILKQKRFTVYVMDLNDDVYELYSSYKENYRLIVNPGDDGEEYDLATLKEFKNVFSEDQLDMLNAMYEKINSVTQKFLSKTIKIMYEETEGSCTIKNSAIKLLLEKAEKYFEIERKVQRWNEHNYTGIIDFTISDGGEELATIRKEVYYCNKCTNDPTVSIGIQKCEKFSFK